MPIRALLPTIVRPLAIASCAVFIVVAAGADASFAADCKTSPITAASNQLHATRADALGEAKFNWVQKVWRKYGPYWHNYAKSVDRKVSCSKKTGGWTCTFSAIPCRSHS